MPGLCYQRHDCDWTRILQENVIFNAFECHCVTFASSSSFVYCGYQSFSLPRLFECLVNHHKCLQVSKVTPSAQMQNHISLSNENVLRRAMKSATATKILFMADVRRNLNHANTIAITKCEVLNKSSFGIYGFSIVRRVDASVAHNDKWRFQLWFS